jgi:Glycosyl transferases group 1
LFYGYDPQVRAMQQISGHAKCVDIMHVGHNWWRWRDVSERLLPAIDRIRGSVGEICFVGMWWDAPPPWAAAIGLEKAFTTDSQRFRELRIRILPAVPYRDVIPTMSSARINIMTQRPLFQRLGLVTAKYFEIFSSDTLPLVMIERENAERIYGPSGGELTLNGDIAAKLIDVLEHPKKYREAAQAVRQYLTAHHSYECRLNELVEILDGRPSAARAG